MYSNTKVCQKTHIRRLESTTNNTATNLLSFTVNGLYLHASANVKLGQDAQCAIVDDDILRWKPYIIDTPEKWSTGGKFSFLVLAQGSYRLTPHCIWLISD